jgi:hypothetical protein
MSLGKGAPYIVAAVLGYAVYMKALNIESFASVTQSMESIPEWIRHYLPVLIPLGELLIAFCLVLPKTRRVAMYASTFLFALFTIYLGYLYKNPNGLACNCFGSGSGSSELTPTAEMLREGYMRGIIRNMFVLFLSWSWFQVKGDMKLIQGGSHEKEVAGVHAR